MSLTSRTANPNREKEEQRLRCFGSSCRPSVDEEHGRMNCGLFLRQAGASPVLRFTVRNVPMARPTSGQSWTSLKRFTHGSTVDACNSEPKSKLHGSWHWLWERGLTVALVGLLPVSIFTSCKSADVALGFVLPIHAHLGIQQVFRDYIHKRKFPIIGRVASGSLFLATALVAIGLFELNLTDIGIGETVRRLWKGKEVVSSSSAK